MPSSTIPISEIIADPRCQARTGIDLSLAHEYAEALRERATLPPLSTIKTDQGHYLYDGFHRFEALRNAGRKEVTVEYEDGDVWDAVERSCSVNSTHGKRRTPADTKLAVERCLEVMAHRGEIPSSYKVAETCAISKSHAHRLLQELSIPYGIDSIPTTVTRNGSTYEMNTSSIGRRKAPDIGAALAEPDVDDEDEGDDYPEVPSETITIDLWDLAEAGARHNGHHQPAPTLADERGSMVAAGLVRANGHEFSAQVAKAILKITGEVVTTDPSDLAVTGTRPNDQRQPALESMGDPEKRQPRTLTIDEDSPLEDQQREFTFTFGSAYLQVYAALVHGPEHVVDWWIDGALPQRTIKALNHLWTPEGIREVARSLADVADVMEDRGRAEFQ